MDEACKDVAEVFKLEFAELVPYCGRMQKLHYRRGEILYDQGNLFDGIYIVVRGIAKIVLSATERQLEAVTGIATRSDVLGSDALHSASFVTRATAVTALTVVKIPTKVMGELLQSNEAFREVIRVKLGRAIAEGLELIELLAKARSEARLAFFLLKLASRVSTGTSAATTFDVGLSRAEIGCYLGINVETVSRRMTTFAEAGYVRVNGKRVRIEDPTALELVREGKTVH